MRMRTILIPVFMGIVLMSSLSMAQYSATDIFNYPVGQNLTGQGTAENGWAGDWHLDPGATVLDSMLSITDTGIPFDDLPYAYPHSGKIVMGSPDRRANGDVRMERTLTQQWPNDSGSVYWFSVFMNIEDDTNSATWAGVKLAEPGHTDAAVMFGKGHGMDFYTCGGGWHGGPGPEVSNVSWDVGPVWLVGAIFNLGPNTPGPAYMWINPDPEVLPDTVTADAMTTSGARTISDVRLEYGGSVPYTVYFADLRMGTSFEDVSSPLVSDEFTATDFFTYPLSQNLTGLGTAENGWAGDWHLDPGATVLDSMMSITDAGIVYDDLPFAYPHSGNIVMGSPDRRTNGDVRMERTLAQQWPNDSGTVYWFSVFMNIEDDTNSATWAGVKLAEPGHTDAAVMFGKGHGMDFYTCGGGWHGGPGPEVSNVSWDVGPVWLLGEIFNLGPSTPGPAYMWINPDPEAQPDTANADAMTTSGARTISDVRLEYGGSVPYTVYFSDLKISNSFSKIIVGIKESFKEFAATTYTLSQNYPNPFNPSTKISYVLKNSGKVQLTVYDLLGREVAELVNEVQSAGIHEVQFNAAGLPSGIYFYRLNSDNGTITKKMLLLK